MHGAHVQIINKVLDFYFQIDPSLHAYRRDVFALHLTLASVHVDRYTRHRLLAATRSTHHCTCSLSELGRPCRRRLRSSPPNTTSSSRPDSKASRSSTA